MRLPRDISGLELARALRRLGDEIHRQSGSHIRLTTQERGEYRVTFPAHDPIKVGTLNAILRDVGEHAGLDRESLLRTLFL